MRLWGGRFGEGPDARMADFTRSIDVDAELRARRHRRARSPTSAASGARAC